MLRRLRFVPLVLALAVAGFLPTLAFSRTALLRATGTTIMLVSQGVTTTLSSDGLEHKVTAMSNTAAQQATIIVVVHGRVIVNSPASGYRSFAINAAWNAAAANVRTAIASVEMYQSDNHPGSRYDPDSSRTDSGYNGHDDQAPRPRLRPEPPQRASRDRSRDPDELLHAEHRGRHHRVQERAESSDEDRALLAVASFTSSLCLSQRP